MLSVGDILTLVLSFALFAIGLLPLELILLRSHSPLTSKLLLVFGFLSSGLALVTIVHTIPNPGFALSDLSIQRISFLILGALTATYYGFTRNLLRPKRRIHTLINVTLVGGWIIALLFFLTDFGISVDADSRDVRLGFAAYVAAGTWLATLATAIWCLVEVEKDALSVFTIPGVALAGSVLAWVASVGSPLVISLAFILIAVSDLFLRLKRGDEYAAAHKLQDLRDVNQRERTRIVAELANTQKELETIRRNFQEANQYRTQFLANMSHELRTPLNSIIGYTELLRDQIYGPLNEKQADRLERIHRNGNHLLELVTDILDLNELDKGKLYLTVEALRLEPLLKSVIEKYAVACAEKGLDFRVNIAPDLPHVFGDRQQIIRLFDSLLDNALKFTDTGAITVSAVSIYVKSGQTEDIALPAIGWLRDGGWVVIKVQDTGIGIAPEDLSRIFDIFTQLDESRTRTHGGTGVGLAIVKRLAELHGGTVWVTSSTDEGSEFFVALPSDHHEKSYKIMDRSES